jgi:plasmid stabilization system protein ParE
MKRKVRISRRAAGKLEDLLTFLEKEWSQKVKNDFIIKLDKTLRNIDRFPESFPESQTQKGLRKCVITRQTSMYYKFSAKTIDIIALFDNRQNPDSLLKELNE